MSFGSDVGDFLTAPDTFIGDLINDRGEKVPLTFDSFKLDYKAGGFCGIQLGHVGSTGPQNELTLVADQVDLKPGMTYPIGRTNCPVKAGFAWEGYVDYLPAIYWGHLSVNKLTSDGQTTAMIEASLSIGWENDEGEEMEVKCSLFRVSS